MSITVTCSECDKKLKVKDEAAGRKVRCPGCDEMIAVPKPVEPELDDLDDFDEVDDEEDLELRKLAKKRLKSSEDEFEEELPRRKASKKGAKKAKPRRVSSGSFLSDFYEGQLSQTMSYVFWGVFAVSWLAASTHIYLTFLFVIVMFFILFLRGLITSIWWAKICAEDSPIAPVIYIIFVLCPVVGLIYGCMNNDRCEKPNRMFMFSIGIAFMSLVALFFAIGIGMAAFNLEFDRFKRSPAGAGNPVNQPSPMPPPNFGSGRRRR